MRASGKKLSADFEQGSLMQGMLGFDSVSSDEPAENIRRTQDASALAGETDAPGAPESMGPSDDLFSAMETSQEQSRSKAGEGKSRRRSKTSASENSYNANDIQVLEGLEPVRKRPALYIGGLDEAGLHHLVWEIVDNSIDEVMNGYASYVELELDADGRGIRVTDNGRGIPVDVHPKYGKSALELIMTTLHAGGKFAGENYQYSGGLHGVGASVVNALSYELEVTVKRDGGEWMQSYRRGKPQGTVKKVGEARGSGTSVWFRPDPEMFADTLFNADIILETLEARAWIHRVRIIFKDKLNGETYRLDHVDQGIGDFLAHIMGEETRASGWDNVFVYTRPDEPKMELALCWSKSSGEHVRSFVNGIRTPQGGTHDMGLKAGVVRAVRNFMDVHDLQPRGLKLSAEDIRDGLRAVISVYVEEPQFKGQTKERLNNPEITNLVANAVGPALESYFNENRSPAQGMVDRIVSGAKERAAISAAVDIVARKSVSHKLNLPGKLADCSSTRPDDSELFIVEGDSAGGSAKQARDRRHQAILPLRGKILNTEKESGKMSGNKEINNLVNALGCGMGSKFDISKLRYGRIVILTDADSDGHHIATLLITFFYRYLPELVREGHIYLGRPPLYRVRIGSNTHWAWTDAERDRLVKKSRSKAGPVITRFKGLGEMSPAQLKETTLDPASRTLFRVMLEDDEAADKVITDCFGDDPEPRRRLIMECADLADEVDI